jgi:type IV secretory pathway TrbL component
LNSGISGARGQLDKAGDVAKGAADTAAGAIAKLPVGRMVDGREKCTVAPNGSPDCYAAASLICKAKGYGEGKSVDTHSAQKCSARVWISGRSPKEGECATETYVIRAVCQ